MSVESFRRGQGWTLEELGERLGLKSKGYVSQLERGDEPWPLETALRLQKISEGQVLARDLIPAEKRELLDQLTASPEAVAS